MRKTLLVALSLLLLSACRIPMPQRHNVSQTSSASSATVMGTSSSAALDCGPEVSLASAPFTFAADSRVKLLMKQGPRASTETDNLIQNAKECGPQRPNAYYQQLADKFKDDHLTIYSIQDYTLPAAIFTVILLPNRMGYASSDIFKGDFFRCGVGGDFPQLASPKWLLFTQSCAGMNQTHDVNNRCLEFEKQLQPSLKLKE